jgi:hypothetical protein
MTVNCHQCEKPYCGDHEEQGLCEKCSPESKSKTPWNCPSCWSERVAIANGWLNTCEGRIAGSVSVACKACGKNYTWENLPG